MIRFAMVAASIASVIVIACLVTIAVQLGRVVTAIDESSRRIPPGTTSAHPVPQQTGQPPTYGQWGPRQPLTLPTRPPQRPATPPRATRPSGSVQFGELTQLQLRSAPAQAVRSTGRPSGGRPEARRGSLQARGAGRPAWPSGRSRWTARNRIEYRQRLSSASNPGATCARFRLADQRGRTCRPGIRPISVH